VEFEGMKFLGLKEYDLYLTTHYGDYMTLPPEEDRHGFNNASKIRLSKISLEEIQERYQKENVILSKNDDGV
jgi:lipopolysaccharide cholinephosphotransferase